MTRHIHVLLVLAIAFMALPPASALGGETELPVGQGIFVGNKCSSCHTVVAAGIGDEQDEVKQEDDGWGDEEEKSGPPDLSSIGSTRTAEWLDLYLQKKETIEDRKHMKRFKGTPEDRTALIDWLLTLKAPGDSLGVQSLADTLGAEPPLGAEGQEVE